MKSLEGKKKFLTGLLYLGTEDTRGLGTKEETTASSDSGRSLDNCNFIYFSLVSCPFSSIATLGLIAGLRRPK